MNTLILPKKVYFKTGCTPVALRELTEVYALKRAFLVTSPTLYKCGPASYVDGCLRRQGMRTAEFFSISSPPAFAQIQSALPKLLEFEPDVIVGVGGGAAMSAAKALWALYENSDPDLEEAVRCPERIQTGRRAKMVLVATSFGSGAQNTPFCVLKNNEGFPCAISSFQLLPEISVTDSRFAEILSPEQTKARGKALLQQVIHAFAAPGCCEYIQGLLTEAARLVLGSLKEGCAGYPDAREKLANADSIAGIACGNIGELPSLELEIFPAAASARVAELARELGFDGAKEFLNACRAICG